MQTIKNLSRLLACRALSATELTQSYLDRISHANADIGAYLTLCGEKAIKTATEIDRRRMQGETLPVLAGIPMAVKDNFCTAGIPTTCASKMLKTFVPPYTATAVSRLEDAGAILLGKLNMDEFAMGATGEYSAFYPTSNPHDLTRMAGGSSAGSAASVAADQAVFSLGSDTGGSVRLPASFCGVVGMKPTYSRISRFGMIAFSSSLDTVGIVTHTLYDSALVLSVMAGEDPMDASCSRIHFDLEITSLNKPLFGLRIGVPEEFFAEDVTYEVKTAIQNVLELYRSLGAVLLPMSLPVTEDSLAVYHILSSAEAASNLARYDGVRYGMRVQTESLEELYQNNGDTYFGMEVQARLHSGMEYLSSEYRMEYHKEAMTKQNAVKQAFAQAFREVDVILMPTATCVAPPSGAFTRGEKRAFDRFTVPASLAGLPAVSVPCHTKNTLPIGFQLIAPAFREDLLLWAGHAYQKEVYGDV